MNVAQHKLGCRLHQATSRRRGAGNHIALSASAGNSIARMPRASSNAFAPASGTAMRQDDDVESVPVKVVLPAGGPLRITLGQP